MVVNIPLQPPYKLGQSIQQPLLWMHWRPRMDIGVVQTAWEVQLQEVIMQPLGYRYRVFSPWRGWCMVVSLFVRCFRPLTNM